MLSNMIMMNNDSVCYNCKNLKFYFNFIELQEFKIFILNDKLYLIW